MKRKNNQRIKLRSGYPLLCDVLAIDTEDLRLIAESLFDIEFGTLSIKEKEALITGFASGVRYSRMKIQQVKEGKQ